jgi:hypothetical protein
MNIVSKLNRISVADSKPEAFSRRVACSPRDWTRVDIVACYFVLA